MSDLTQLTIAEARDGLRQKDFTARELTAAGRDVIARARCVKRTRNVAFVRTEAYQDDPDDPIAMCTATFMIGTRNTARDGAQS